MAANPGLLSRKCSDCHFVFEREEAGGKPTAKGFDRYQCPRCGEIVFTGDPL